MSPESSAPAAPAGSRREWWATVVGLVLIGIYGAWLRARDLDPVSLWLDDAWVAVISRGSLRQVLSLGGAASPPLFNLAIAACRHLVADPELGAQLFPFLCGTLVAPLAGATGWRLTGRPAAGLAAALLVTCDPLAVTYSARVKPYSSDALLTLAHVWFLTSLARDEPPRPILVWGWAALAALGLGLSSVSIFTVSVFFALTLFVHWRAGRRSLHVPLATGVVGLTCLASVGLLLLPGVNAAMDTWWQGYFFEAWPPGALALGLWRVAQGWTGEPLHANGRPELVLFGAAGALLGLRALRRAGQARFVTAVVGLLGALLLACALGRFPLGSGRVELFLLPALAILIGAGALEPERLLQAPAWRRAWPYAALVLLGLQVVEPRARRDPYYEQHAAPLVAELATAMAPGDALLVNDLGAFALSYYGPWPVEFLAYPPFGTGFATLPARERTTLLPTSPELLPAALSQALQGAPPRAWLFLCHHYALDEHVPATAKALGWRAERRAERPACVLFLLTPEVSGDE